MELLIVTYHYILPENIYKRGIYPVSCERFAEHLDILSKTHLFIHENDLVEAITNKKKLPEKACLISFDDGLRAQFDNAVPILQEKNIPAVFFISTQAYKEGKAAVVHKIHYLLAHVAIEDLLHELEESYKKFTCEQIVWKEVENQKIKKWYIYDDKSTATFKFLLNHLLPPQLANQITEDIFNKLYKEDEHKFSGKLYLGDKQINELRDSELFSIGLHSHTHMDISKHTLEDVVSDFKKNFEILKNDFRIKNIFGLSYPYGITDDGGEEDKINRVAETLSLTYGVTTEKGININLRRPLLLKRFNPNDIKQLT